MKKIYTVRDGKAEIYLDAITLHNTHGEAERAFGLSCQNEKSMISLYPEDYDLWYIGDYDPATGLVKPQPTPLHVCKAVEVLQRINASRSGANEVNKLADEVRKLSPKQVAGIRNGIDEAKGQ